MLRALRDLMIVIVLAELAVAGALGVGWLLTRQIAALSTVF
jgi:hypothetical protein